MINYEALSIQELNTLAKQGDASAQVMLGVNYWDGDGVSQDAGKAIDWLSKAAEQDEPQAIYMLGMVCLVDDDHLDLEKAARYFTKAAGLGYSPAMTDLAVMFLNGDGIKKDADKARELLEKAQALGDERAGEILEGLEGGNFDGEGTPVSVEILMKDSAEFVQKVFEGRLFGKEKDLNIWKSKYEIPVRINYLHLRFRTSKEFTGDMLKKVIECLAAEMEAKGLAETGEEVRRKIVSTYNMASELFGRFYDMGMVNMYQDAVNVCFSILLDCIPKENYRKEEKTLMTELNRVYFNR